MDTAPDPEPDGAATDGADSAASGAIPELSFEEARVLGCLLEKEMTTPEYYPLTMKAVMTACNQRSNRDPVIAFDTPTVKRAMEDLRYKHLAISIHEAGARVPKCKHILDRFFPYLQRKHFALLAVLMLRGQQTLGEIRTRTERMHAFADLESTQAALDDLVGYDPEPLVKHLPAGGGRRVATFVHLLSADTGGTGETGDASAPSVASTRETETPTWREEIESSIAALQSEVAALKAELESLK